MQNNRKNNRSLKKIILFLCFLALFFDSQNDMKNLSDQYRTVSIRLEEGISGMELYGTDSSQEPEYSVLFAKQTLGLPEEEIFQITAWQWGEAVTLTEPALGRKGKAALIKVWGVMEDVLPVTLKEGSFCTPEDKKGCVIDAETAYELFGTVKVIGNQILIGEKSYRIRGVTEAALPVAMIIETDRANVFKQIEIKCANPLREFTSSEEFAIIESPFYMDLLKRFLYLPVWMLLCWIFFLAFQKVLIVQEGKMILNKKKEMRKIYGAGIALLIGAAFIVIGLKQEWLYFPFFLPERYIPSRWSDFSFWEQRWRDLKSLRQQLLYLHPCPKDVMLWEQLRFLVLELAAEVFVAAGLIKE